MFPVNNLYFDCDNIRKAVIIAAILLFTKNIFSSTFEKKHILAAIISEK